MTFWLQVMGTSTWFFSIASLFILIIRKPTRSLFGSTPVYLLWAILPLVWIVTFLAPRTTGPRIFVNHTLELVEKNQATVAIESLDFMTLFFIWALGFVAFTVTLLIRQYRFDHQIGETIHIETTDNIDVVVSANILTPIACGVLKKRIVLPDSFEDLYSAEARQLIMNHELVHLQRHDPLANLIAEFLCCLFWFNPLAHLIKHCFRTDQELSCDEIVLKSAPHLRTTYARALLQTAESNTNFGVGWLSTSPEMKQRIKALSQPEKSNAMRRAGYVIVVLTVAFAGTVAHAFLPDSPSRTLDFTTQPFMLDQLSAEELGKNLIHAVQTGDTSLLEQLLVSGAPTEYEEPGIGTPLILATKLGQIESVLMLVEAKADVNATVLGTGSPLIMAAKHDHREIAEFLIASGGDVNAHVFFDETPLINAARFGHLEMTRKLVDAGADVQKSVTTFSITHLPLGTKSPMSEAKRVGHSEIFEYLKLQAKQE